MSAQPLCSTASVAPGTGVLRGIRNALPRVWRWAPWAGARGGAARATAPRERAGAQPSQPVSRLQPPASHPSSSPHTTTPQPGVSVVSPSQDPLCVAAVCGTVASYEDPYALREPGPECSLEEQAQRLECVVSLLRERASEPAKVSRAPRRPARTQPCAPRAAHRVALNPQLERRAAVLCAVMVAAGVGR
jgi:hypothetical protein